MSSIDSLQRARALALKLCAALAFLAPLLTRLVMGQAYHQNGAGKIENFARTVAFFGSLGIPMPEANAFFISRLEYWGGLLLVVGLFTRVVAALFSCQMIVALLTADRGDFLEAFKGAGEKGLTDVTSFVFLMIVLWLVFFGPGKVSLDALIARWLDRKAAAAT